MKSVFKSIISHWYIPITIFLVSRVFVFGIVWIASMYNFEQGANLVRWDAPSYISIATDGYQFDGEYLNSGSFIAFFPLFPVLMSGVSLALKLSVAQSGLIISFLFGLASAVLLYHLVSKWKNMLVGTYAVLLYSFYPFSVFLSAPYTESLFMFLLLAYIYLMHQSKFLHAAGIIGLASVTKMFGGILGAIYAVTMFFQEDSYRKIFRNLLIASAPFIIFLGFQYIKYGTFFAFMNAQSANWNQHTVWPWEGLYLFVKRMLFDPFAHGFHVQSGIMLFAVLVTLWVSRKSIPKDVWYIGLMCTLFVLTSDNILGIGRYVIICLPLYYYWAHRLYTRQWLAALVIAASAMWLGFVTVLYATNQHLF